MNRRKIHHIVKAKDIIKKTVKVAAWTLMAALLLVCAALTLLYSPWSQDLLCRYINATMSEGDMRVSVESFRLHFPLDIEAQGVRLEMPGPQTIEAARLTASVKLLPLLEGRADISGATLGGARLSIGAPDSAMYMDINADSIALTNAAVALKTMNIEVNDGLIARGGVSLDLNPVPAATDTATAEPSEMKICIRRMRLTDFAYRMRMLPTIDSLGAKIPEGVMCGGLIDMKSQTIRVGSFTGAGLQVSYIAPDSATVAATPEIPASETTSAPWTVRLDTVGFSDCRALYTTRGVTPVPGLDFGYIEADSLTLGVSRFYNRAEQVRVPLTLSGTERCGVRLNATGTLDIDSVGTGFRDFVITTANQTDLRVSGLLGMGDMTTDPATVLSLDADGYVSTADLRLMFPAAVPFLAGLPPAARLYAEADIKGTAGDLAVDNLALAVNGCVKLKAKGSLQNVFDPARMGGNLTLSGALIDLNPIKNSILEPATAREVNIPYTTLDGAVTMRGGTFDGRLRAVTGKGNISLKGRWNGTAEAYAVDLTTDRFPVNAFMPNLGAGSVTASLDATGRGLDFFSSKTMLDATLDVKDAEYRGHSYGGVSGHVSLEGGMADINVESTDPDALFGLTATGNLDGATYAWEADLSGVHADLKALGLSPTQTTVDGHLSAEASVTPREGVIAARLVVHDLTYTDSIGHIDLNNITARLNADDSTTNLSVHNRDLYAFLSSDAPIDTIMARMARLTPVIDDEIARRTVDIERLQRTLPPFVLDVNAGPNNFITDIMGETKTGFSSMSMTAANDSSLSFNARVLEFKTETMRLDTIGLDIAQYGPRMVLAAKVDNRPGTFDEWAHVRLDGYMADNRLGMTVTQQNIAGKTGYDVGLDVRLNDSTLVLSVDPTDPTIAYQPWTVNEDNYIKWSFAHKHIDANLHMHGAGSSLAIYTNHIEGQDDHQEELVVDISDIKIADWIKLNPFAPPMDGLLSANLKVSAEGKDINGAGTVSLTDFMYDRQRVGTIGADLKVSTDLGGRIRAQADVSIDSVRTITLAGALNDSTAGSPLALDFSMIHFPLTTVNPFMPAGTAKLRGTLNGSLKISGDSNNPVFNGFINFDSTAVKLALTGAEYKFSDSKIPVDSGMVTLTDFEIAGVNGEPLKIDGTVALRPLSNPTMELKLSANNMQLVNNLKPAKGADVYGKAFISLNGTVKGNMDLLRVKADLKLLSGTNVTYVIPNATSAIESQATEGMVKFVNLSDTAAVAAADSLTANGMALLLQALLTIQNGTTVNVDLSPDGKDKISLNSNGTLDFSMTPVTDGRLSGRLNIDGGFVRYSPPVISQKYFTFKEGSYIAFSGDMLNPTLNIDATDVIKANVTQEGQDSRLVNFDVGLSVTGTLKTMKVLFDLSTRDDITVQNELESMSADQRQNQAINLMLYNVYTGPGTRGDASLGGNPLMSFLASTANSWLANNIKGVDISLGINQYDRTVNGSSSQTMSYSYQVSKSLFNDRLRIIVGGNYSTDANADENFSQNLINDISFEYFLNKTRTMYLRIFRHTGYESILEGEITQTGVGFVYRRKLRRLGDMFLPPALVRRREEAARAAEEAARNQVSETDKTVKP